MLTIVSSAAFADYPVSKVKPKELEVLAEAVRTENHRKRALEAQTGYICCFGLHSLLMNKLTRGLLTFATRDDKDFFEWNTDGIDWGRVAEKVIQLLHIFDGCSFSWVIAGIDGCELPSNGTGLRNPLAGGSSSEIYTHPVGHSRDHKIASSDQSYTYGYYQLGSDS